MTKSDLIKQLAHFPDDAIVVVPNRDRSFREVSASGVFVSKAIKNGIYIGHPYDFADAADTINVIVFE